MIEFEKFLRKRYSEAYLNEIFNPNVSKALILETYRGDVVIELFHKDVSLVKEVIARDLLGDYDGMTFHNCNPFFVQVRKNNLEIEGKPKQIVPYLRNLKGTVGLVNSKKKTTNSLLEHFYICLKDVPEFDGKYTVIGKVVKGLDVLNKVWDGNTVKAVYIAKNYSKKQGVGNGLNFLFWMGLILAFFYFLRFFSDKIQSLKIFEESLFGSDITKIVPKPFDLIILILSVVLMLLAVVVAPLARKVLENGADSEFKKKTAGFEKSEKKGKKLSGFEGKVKGEEGADERARVENESTEVLIEEQRKIIQEETKGEEKEEKRRSASEEEKKLEVEQFKKKLEEDIAKMQKEKEKLEEVKKYEKIKGELEEKTRKQEEELRRKLTEEERRRKLLEATNKKGEEELKKKHEREEQKRQLDEEKKKKKLQEIEKKAQLEEEKRRKKLEEEMAKKTLELERKLEQEKRRVEKEEEKKRKIKVEMSGKQEKEGGSVQEPMGKDENPDLARQQFVGNMGADSDTKEKLKGKDKEKIKQEVLPQIAKRTETHLDVLYDLLEKYNLLKLSYIMKTFGIDKEEALEWCNILVEHGLAELSYPAFGEPSLKKKS